MLNRLTTNGTSYALRLIEHILLSLISSRNLAQKVLSAPPAALIDLSLWVEAIWRLLRILTRVMLGQVPLVEFTLPHWSAILVLILPLNLLSGINT